MKNKLTDQERKYLLVLARCSVEKAAAKETLPTADLDSCSKIMREDGASFVTLTKKGKLRGCIGAIEAYQSLVLDVIEHAAAAAVQDYRFPNVTPGEVEGLEIEISYLTPPTKIAYKNPQELKNILRPHLDGVILRDGFARATFLPQVWEKLPDVEDFLGQLCLKMGSVAETWKRKILDVEVYQVEEFSEKECQG